MKLKNTIGAVMAIALSAVLMGGPAHASGSDEAIDIVPVTGEAAQAYTDASLEAIENGDVETVAPFDAYAPQESEVYTIGTEVTAVTIPLHGDYSLPSNVTVFLDSDKTALQTNEMLVTTNDAGNLQVETYLDSELVKSQDTGIPYMTDEELLQPLDTDIQPQGVPEVAVCLGAVLGVGGAVATVIAIACGGSCAVPLTPITAPVCAACIGGFALVGGASIGGVAACFQLL